MSLPWLDRLHVVLAPATVVCATRRRGFGRAAAPQRTVLRCGPASEGPPWAPAVDTLREWLAGQPLRGARVRVVLSDHFTRYAMLPWHGSLTGRAEREGLARHLFESRFGEVAQGWSVHVGRCGYGQAALACAVDRALLEAIEAACAMHGLRLSGACSLLAIAADGFAARVGRDAGLLVLEPGRLSGLSVQQGGCHAVHSMRLGRGAWDGAWVARQADMMGMDRSRPLYLAVADAGVSAGVAAGVAEAQPGASATVPPPTEAAPYEVLLDGARGTPGALWSLAAGALA